MTDPIDAFFTMVGYGHHLLPIFDALPADRKGHVYVPSDLRRQVTGERVRYTWPPSSSAPLLVAGAQDLNHAIRGKVFVEHGAGQRYAGVESFSYAGGPGREQVGLFLCPRSDVADANLARYPRAHGAAVGAAKLDAWRTIPTPDDGTVGVTWHWPCRLRDVDGNNVPESGWAWESWRDAVAELAKTRKVLGHGHPRARYLLEEYWASIGVEAVWDATELLARVDVLVADNTSLAPEFAACGRPIVWLNDATWRRDAEHGGRFWDWPEGQVSCWPGDDLCASVEIALEDWPAMRHAREAMVRSIYGAVDGRSSERAVEAVLAWETQR